MRTSLSLLPILAVLARAQNLTVTYQAEDAVLTGVTVKTAQAGFTGIYC